MDPSSFDNSNIYSHNQPLGLSSSNFTNMLQLSSSPLKPSNYYFDETNQFEYLSQDENKSNTSGNTGEILNSQFLPQNQDHTTEHNTHNSGNETDDDRTDDEMANVIPSDDLVVHASSNHKQQSLQYPPVIEKPAKNHQYKVQQHFQAQQQNLQLHKQQQNLQHNDKQQLPQQTNLYPPMEYFPLTRSTNGQKSFLPESNSTNTISSLDSMPFLTSSMVSSSISDNSISSPGSFSHSNNTTLMTPQRFNGNRRTSFSTTPVPKIYQTPSQYSQQQQQHHSASHQSMPLSHSNQHLQIFTSPLNLKNGVTPSRRSTISQSANPSSSNPPKTHRRTRSRLSLDASGAAAIVTSTSYSSKLSAISRSPSVNNGTNPFYNPTSFLSPAHSKVNTSVLNSPASTPLATPTVKRENYNNDDELNENDRIRKISTISPTMLMNTGGKVNKFSNAADLPMKLASTFIGDPDLSFSGFDESRELSNFKIDPCFLIDPENCEMTSVPSSAPPITNSQNSRKKPHKKLSRSQSSTNLASFTKGSDENISKSEPSTNTVTTPIILPNNLKYDKPVVANRGKKLIKSNSTTSIIDPKTKKTKKLHPCPICGKLLQRPEHVKRHMNSHSSEKPFVCDEPGCGTRFNRNDNLKAHIRNIHHRNP
ncbi:hypothetical protein WICMUC_002343 [Wickerhamomyces mucosus]|uniref:C2H2-type domain-containing protein n=1 Tax=Wickerhamomyces mucosus TaxID=1378264 RepID=A0A9P8PPX4_9ASCO|nr:hypothetical protein WICMUC_002343 [Wickerhamomyces mucosus]